MRERARREERVVTGVGTPARGTSPRESYIAEGLLKEHKRQKKVST